MVTLLTGRIPDLELHRRIVDGNRLGKERSTDRRFLQLTINQQTNRKYQFNNLQT